MLLVLRIITIIIAIACLVGGVWLIVAGVLETPADSEAILIGVGICLYYLADLYLLKRSYEKKHTPAHWAAFLLGLLPVLIVLLMIVIASLVDQI
ncbi:hypothetical protein [Paraflavitalea pollutisoli]|uniref:hypothetical protein n=1 Tax=Paraflavitalea pollutisoli TaxID=3034143 RepID=UPI0023EE1429|nr:hypothetical protein [Paraflavitalea sp. H1-2-19X]